MFPSVPIRLADSWPPDDWCDVTVLVAVSGGSDSVALLRGLVSLKKRGGGRLVAAHFNHRLRAAESDADEAFVVRLCDELGIDCALGRAQSDLPCNHGGEGLEAAARRFRYHFFRQTADRLGARFLATGHTADDQVETILHRLVRGTGIAGLSGMARCRPLSHATTLIRPLLNFRRGELIAYLDQLGQPYRTDSSNTSDRHTRNRIRHELIPLLAERFNPSIGEALLRLGTIAGEVQSVVDQLVEQLADRAVVEQGGTLQIDTAAVAREPVVLIRELFIHLWRSHDWPMQSMGYAEWDLLADMLLADRTDKRIFPGNVTAQRTETGLLLFRHKSLEE